MHYEINEGKSVAVFCVGGIQFTGKVKGKGMMEVVIGETVPNKEIISIECLILTKATDSNAKMHDVVCILPRNIVAIIPA